MPKKTSDVIYECSLSYFAECTFINQLDNDYLEYKNGLYNFAILEPLFQYLSEETQKNVLNLSFDPRKKNHIIQKSEYLIPLGNHMDKKNLFNMYVS